MKEIKKIEQAARRWQFVVGCYWERFQCRLLALYYWRVTYPVRVWRAFGCPEQFRPRLPWWQHFVWVWLSSTGWLVRE
jgi:hypothetical protein